MDLKEFLNRSAIEVDREIESFFPKKFSTKWLETVFGKPEFGFDLETLDRAIAVPLWDFFDRGGKRWRPALMLLCAEAVGGSRKKALPFTTIPELAHMGTLIIDDIEDGTQMRRGKPVMHKLFGTDLAINNGTLLYFLPLALLFSNQKISMQVKSRLYDIYNQEMLKLSFGQGMDILWHQGGKKNISEEAYLQMCSFKTGTLSRMSARFGAVLGGAPARLEVLLGNFANTIGVAFQIHDDVLNLSEEKSLGKEFAEDIHEGKRTLMVIHCLKNASGVDAARLEEILLSHPTDHNAKREAISIMSNAGSIEYAKNAADALVKKAWEKAKPALKPSKSRDLLEKFAKYLVERKN